MTTTPTPEELEKALDAYCHAKDCHLCDGSMLTFGCAIDFMHGVLTGEIGLDGEPIKREEPAPAKPVLPKWCKVGAWVLEPDKTLWIVDGIHEDIVTLKTYPGSPCSMSLAYRRGTLRPARFRAPTLEEAYKLAGEPIIFDEDDNDGDDEMKSLEVIYYVRESRDGKEVLVNSRRFSCWKARNATIDNIPFGVPEIDTEAEMEETK